MTDGPVAIATALTPVREDEDLLPIQAALQAAGVDAEIPSWDDATVNWSRYRMVVIRSTWNYIHNLDAYRGWIDHVATVSRLHNPASVVQWNLHKRYLVELAEAGLPVVPSVLVPQGGAAVVAEHGQRWGTLVIKPAVSAGSFGTMKVLAQDAAAGQAHLDSFLGQRDMLIQPYLPSVSDEGEHALLFFAGTFSHVVRKGARFKGDREATSVLPDVASDELDAASRILAAVRPRFEGRAPLYARVDLARNDRGLPMLMELELIEPALFLQKALPVLGEGPMQRYVGAVVDALQAG